jgi:AcrR family transcriptional regulator
VLQNSPPELRYRTTITNSSSQQTAQRKAYDSPARRQQAESTRTRIIGAAHDLFFEKGYAATTLKEIADRAGVSEQTIYAAFSSKRRVLLEVFQAARTAEPESSKDTKTRFAGPEDVPTPQSIARSVRKVRDGGAPVARIIQAAGDADPELAQLWQEIQGERHERMGELAQMLASAGLLRSDIGVDKATDILWTLTSNDNYAHLVLERGWSPDQYESWLEGALASTVIAVDGTKGAGGL